MSGYNLILLKEMLEELEEDKVKEILSSFSCPLNSDVESFLRDKAIEFEKQSYSSTYLISTSYKQEEQLAGYFTISQKQFTISSKRSRRRPHVSPISKTQIKKIAKYGTYDKITDVHTIPAPLIGQLSKNFACGDGKRGLISGDELLKIACDKVWEIQRLFSGRIVYLECEEESKLIDFYTSNGFVEFGTRSLDPDEKDDLSGDFLVQMLKDLKANYERNRNV